jgi:uncharacterized protein YjaG (DUF416 family)
MREVKNCRMCNMIFSTQDGALLCKKCQMEEEKTFRVIRDYLYENPGASVQDLSIQFNVNVRRISEYVRNGRFDIT